MHPSGVRKKKSTVQRIREIDVNKQRSQIERKPGSSERRDPPLRRNGGDSEPRSVTCTLCGSLGSDTPPQQRFVGTTIQDLKLHINAVHMTSVGELWTITPADLHKRIAREEKGMNEKMLCPFADCEWWCKGPRVEGKMGWYSD